MKRNIKSITAFILILVLLAASPIAVYADTASSGTITGASTVDNVVLNVLLPTSLDFALDPLSLDGNGDNQIAAQDFFFVNQSFAPVKVAVNINATTSGDAVLVADTSGLAKDDTSVTTKELYFGVLGANGITGTAITAAAVVATDEAITSSGIFTGTQAEYTTVSALADTLVALTPGAGGTTGSAVISFALDKAIANATTTNAIDSLATSNAGIAAFQFYSELNTYADWRANDITVSGSYTLTPLRTTTYDSYTTIAGSLNQLEPPAASTYTITVENDGHGTATASAVTAAAGATITLSATPSSGYQFSSWSSTPGALVSSNSFTMPASNVTVQANFTAIPVGFIGGSSTTTTSITVGTIVSGSALEIPFYLGSNTVSTIKTASGTTTLVLNTDYTVDSANHKIIFSTARTTLLRNLTVNTFNTITLSNNSTYIINFVQ